MGSPKHPAGLGDVAKLKARIRLLNLQLRAATRMGSDARSEMWEARSDCWALRRWVASLIYLNLMTAGLAGAGWLLALGGGL